DGSHINVTRDLWIHMEDELWVSSPQERANAILFVPLFDVVEEDTLVWNDDMYEIVCQQEYGCKKILLSAQGNVLYAWKMMRVIGTFYSIVYPVEQHGQQLD
ncbi:hypothetical protein A2U01_0022328, partial [Trifolium medium]|nr:hypothetical protein [Trifolium medium]